MASPRAARAGAPPPRVPNEESLPPERAALIRDALATHRAKRRILDDLTGEDRSLLEAVAFSLMFFPSAHAQVSDTPGPIPPPGSEFPGSADSSAAPSLGELSREMKTKGGSDGSTIGGPKV